MNVPRQINIRNVESEYPNYLYAFMPQGKSLVNPKGMNSLVGRLQHQSDLKSTAQGSEISEF